MSELTITRSILLRCAPAEVCPEENKMMYTVNPGIWTELAEHGVELIHHAGQAITIEVIDGRIETTPDHVECQLRAPGGRYPERWQAPISGRYIFGFIDGQYETATRIDLSQEMVVLQDVRRIDTQDGGTAYASPEIAMSSGQPLMTGNRRHSLDVDWHSS